MSLPPLATADDVSDRLQRDLTPQEEVRLASLLVDVSARARRVMDGQQIPAGTSTVRVPVRNGRVRLPQKPVTAVSAVTDLNDGVISYLWDTTAGQFVDVCGSALVINATSRPRDGSVVKVTYAHGYATVPDDIVAVVCSAVIRSLASNPAEAGIATTSIDGYTETRGAVGAAGPLGLFDEEKAVLRAYGGGTAGVIATMPR